MVKRPAIGKRSIETSKMRDTRFFPRRLALVASPGMARCERLALPGSTCRPWSRYHRHDTRGPRALPDTASTHEPEAAIERAGDEVRAVLSGRWTVDRAEAVEERITEVAAAAEQGRRVLIDLSHVDRLDTLGAWVLDRTRHELGTHGLSADFVGARAEHHILLNEVAYRGFQPVHPVRRSPFVEFLADIGRAVAGAGRDVIGGVGFLGQVVAAFLRVMTRPAS